MGAAAGTLPRGRVPPRCPEDARTRQNGGSMPASPASSSAVRRLGGVAADAVLALLALGGILLLLRGRPLGLALLAVALVGAVAQLTAGWRRPAARPTGLGRAQVLRALVVGGAAVAFVPDPGAAPAGTAWPAGVAAVLLVVALVAEPFVARAAGFRVPVAAHLPGVAPVPRHPDLRPHALLASLAAAGLGLLLAGVGAPAWSWLLVAVLAVLPLGLLAVTGVAKILIARRRRQQVPKALARYAPDVVLYTGRPDDASYQLTMWLPYLRRTGCKFVIITRNAVPAAALAELTDVPVVEVRAVGDLDRYVVPSLRAALYVNASSANGALVRFQHLTHVYIGHGDSDKPPSYNPTHALYDEIFAAGPAATRRYAAHGVRIAPEKFRVVGRPQVEEVQPAGRPIGEVAEPVVLYAPTWRGHVEETMLYSLPRAERIVRALLDRGTTVVFRPHPFSYDFPDDSAVIRRVHALLEAERRRTGRAHLWGAAAERERSVLECLNLCDALVTDVSSVVSDHLQSGKPFAMVAVPSEPVPFVAEYPVAAAAYVIRGDLTDLEEQLDQMLGPDPLRERRLAVRADYLGDFSAERYADAFVQAVRQLNRKPVHDLEVDDADTEGESPTGESRAGEEDDRPLPGREDAPADQDDAEDEGGDDGEDAPAEAARALVAGARASTVSTRAAPGRPSARPGRRGGLVRYARPALRIGLDLGGTVLALVALVTALLGAPAWAPVVLGVLALLAGLLPVRRDVLRRRRQSRLLTEAETTRAVLLVTVAVLAADQGRLSWPVGVGLLVLAVSLVGERRVQAAWGRVGLTVVNLPGAVRPVRQRVPRGWLTLAGLGAVVVSLLLLGVVGTTGAGAGLVPAWFVAVALADALLFVAVLQRALVRAREVEAGAARLRPALAAHAPEFVLYLSSEARGDDQVARWLPDLGQVGRPFVVVTRSVDMLRHVAKVAARAGVVVPVVHRPSLRSLDDVVAPSLTTAFYVTNGVRNSHFVERRELTHVWLNSGTSEQAAAYNPVHAIYDLILVPDVATRDRYAEHGVHIPEEKFVVVGPEPDAFVRAAQEVVAGHAVAAVAGPDQP